MTSRSLTEFFVLFRNNVIQNKNIYSDNKNGDSEHLLRRSLHDIEEGNGLRDDYDLLPPWIDKLEEAQYTLSKIKPKLDELSSLHARHLLRPTLDDQCEEETLIENLSQDISKIIATAHRQIQFIRSHLGQGNKLEQRLTKNVTTYLLISLQEVTSRYRRSQNLYLHQLNSREERSNVFFETDFTTIELNETSNKSSEPGVDNVSVTTFDNFLKPKTTTVNYLEDTDEQIDEYFQQSIPSRMSQKQLFLFEEENTREAEHREIEVTKIVKSIIDLHDIFKDLSHIVTDQGTVLDRIDYNIEVTQVKVTEGFKQLQKAEAYQRKNRKMICILILATVTLLMLFLLIIIKF